VLDEYGGTAGMITIEDLLEEIVGEIDSEHDRKADSPIKVNEQGVAEVDARARMAYVNERLDLELEEGEDYDTVGGFVLSHLGRVPKTGERFVVANGEFMVLKADARRIGKLRLKALTPEPG
jgi:CBS domain containing-hemolysin-like protein